MKFFFIENSSNVQANQGLKLISRSTCFFAFKYLIFENTAVAHVTDITTVIFQNKIFLAARIFSSPKFSVTIHLRGETQIKMFIINVDLISKSWPPPPPSPPPTQISMYIFDQTKIHIFPNKWQLLSTHTKILFCILTALLPSNSYYLHDIVNCRNRFSKTKTRKLLPQCCFPIQLKQRKCSKEEVTFRWERIGQNIKQFIFSSYIYIYQNNQATRVGSYKIFAPN